jgi:hypothetical protein
MTHPNSTTGTLLDANGDPVPLPDGMGVDDTLRLFFASRVPARQCPHYIAVSEARAGFQRCERC